MSTSRKSTTKLLAKTYKNLRRDHGLSRLGAARQLYKIIKGDEVRSNLATGEGLDMQQQMIDELATSRAMYEIEQDLPPRFKIWGDEGERLIIAPFKQDEPDSLLKTLSLVKTYMVWQNASKFIMAGEGFDPENINITMVSKNQIAAACQLVTKQEDKILFGNIEWVPASECDPVIIDLLPGEDDELSDEQIRECKKLFGEGGDFEQAPVVH